MYKFDDAVQRARLLALKDGEPRFVVYERDEYDLPTNDFHVCTELEYEQYYYGCKVLHSTEDDLHDED